MNITMGTVIAITNGKQWYGWAVKDKEARKVLLALVKEEAEHKKRVDIEYNRVLNEK